MKILTPLFFLLLTTTTFSQNNSPKLKLKKGNWSAELKLTDSDVLPFKLTVDKNGKDTYFSVHNAEEIIQLKTDRIENDSLHILFNQFNSELVVKVNSKKKISGYWVNHNKVNYRIPFEAHYGYSTRFKPVDTDLIDQNFDGKWEATFEPNTLDQYPALGIFKQSGNEVTGTFLTETGDYRYLEGNVFGSQMFLSCFDGSHAFLFKSTYLGTDHTQGSFFSGKHWESEWIAKRNESFKLPDPDSLTFITNNGPELSFTLPTLNNQPFTYPSADLSGKVVIIQIMGSWCPNCMDETRYYKELYDKYHAQGLEIIAIGYETGKDTTAQLTQLERYKQHMNIDYKILLGGTASKNVASDQFNMLNEVISFPTSIFIGKDGTVKRVHTGFNGPGTGEYYKEYVKKTNALIEELLAY